MAENRGTSGLEPIQFSIVQRSTLALRAGNSTTADIDVYWPNGLHETYKRIAGISSSRFREGIGLVPGRGFAKGK